MAAPHGLFWRNTVLIFKGQFSGYPRSGYSVYTIPTKPGSSGSPIINSNNELVGIIFAGYRSMENIGVASPLIAVKVFLKKSIAQAEMKVWNTLNKGVDKTSITSTKKLEELQSKLDKYFHIPSVNKLDR
jgi:S1-C subfamily serine protease